MAEAERNQIVEYHYTNHIGEVVRIKTRYPDKSFSWSELLKADEETPKIYRFDRIVRASGEGTKYSQIIYLVEGEKDVKTLESIGKLATTAYQSSYKFDDDYILRFFEDKTIVILPDNDEKGREYSETAARAFKKSGYPASVKIVDLAKIFPYEFEEKWDITDFLENWPEEGQSPREIFNEEIEKRLNEFPEYELTEEEQDQKDEPEDNFNYPELESLNDLLEKDLERVVFLIENVMPSHGLIMLSGPAKVGKTFFCLHFAISLVSGGEYLGQKMPSNFGHVLYIDPENDESSIQDRAKHFINEHRDKISVEDRGKLLFAHDVQRLLDEHSFVDQIKHYRKTDPEIRCIIVDTYMHITSEKKYSMTLNQHEGRELEELLKYVHDENLLCILVNHTGKEVSPDVFLAQLGTTATLATVDHFITFSKQVNAETSATEEYGLHIKGRYCEEKHFKMEFHNRNWRIVEDLESKQKYDAAKIFLNNPYVKAIKLYYKDPNKKVPITASEFRPYLAQAQGYDIEQVDKPITVTKNLHNIKERLENFSDYRIQICGTGKNTKAYRIYVDPASKDQSLSWDAIINDDIVLENPYNSLSSAVIP